MLICTCFSFLSPYLSLTICAFTFFPFFPNPTHQTLWTHTYIYANQQADLIFLPPVLFTLIFSLEVEDLWHLHLVGPHKVTQLKESPRPQR